METIHDRVTPRQLPTPSHLGENDSRALFAIAKENARLYERARAEREPAVPASTPAPWKRPR